MNEVSSKHSSEVSEDIPLEAGEDSQADNNRDPNLVEENACLKIPTCLFHGNEEALAWAIDNCITITAFIGVGAFLGTVSSRSTTQAIILTYFLTQTEC